MWRTIHNRDITSTSMCNEVYCRQDIVYPVNLSGNRDLGNSILSLFCAWSNLKNDWETAINIVSLVIIKTYKVIRFINMTSQIARLEWTLKIAHWFSKLRNLHSMTQHGRLYNSPKTKGVQHCKKLICIIIKKVIKVGNCYHWRLKTQWISQKA